MWRDEDEPVDSDLVLAAAAAGRTERSVRAAVNMRISGAPYDEIARVLDYTSAAAARAAVEQGLADAYEGKDTASLRRLTNARLEGLFKLSWENAQPSRPSLDRESGEPDGFYERNPEQAAWVRQAADIAGRLAKLHGLDAPTQVQVSPGAIEFEETVAHLVAVTQKGLPQEADIFALPEDIEDAVVVEDGELDG